MYSTTWCCSIFMPVDDGLAYDAHIWCTTGRLSNILPGLSYDALFLCIVWGSSMYGELAGWHRVHRCFPHMSYNSMAHFIKRCLFGVALVIVVLLNVFSGTFDRKYVCGAVGWTFLPRSFWRCCVYGRHYSICLPCLIRLLHHARIWTCCTRVYAIGMHAGFTWLYAPCSHVVVLVLHGAMPYAARVLLFIAHAIFSRTHPGAVCLRGGEC